MKRTIINQLLAIAIIVCTFFVTINFWSFNKNFYTYEYQKSEVATKLEIDDKTLEEASDYLFDYLKNEHDNLDYQINTNGQVESFYTYKDSLHMRDVKKLYNNFKLVSLVSFIFILIAISYLNYVHASFNEFYIVFERTLLVLIAIIGTCLFLMWQDFATFWYNLHFLFFENMLWVISPSESRLIIMMNQTLFNDLLFLIAISIIILLGVIFYIFRIYKEKEKKL